MLAGDMVAVICSGLQVAHILLTRRAGLSLDAFAHVQR
jgi:hypothetical protein